MLDGRASAGASVDSARQNLAATFVNAFVNAGFGQVRALVFYKKYWRQIFRGWVHVTFVAYIVVG